MFVECKVYRWSLDVYLEYTIQSMAQTEHPETHHTEQKKFTRSRTFLRNFGKISTKPPTRSWLEPLQPCDTILPVSHAAFLILQQQRHISYTHSVVPIDKFLLCFRIWLDFFHFFGSVNGLDSFTDVTWVFDWVFRFRDLAFLIRSWVELDYFQWCSFFLRMLMWCWSCTEFP